MIQHMKQHDNYPICQGVLFTSSNNWTTNKDWFKNWFIRTSLLSKS